ncbi:MAG: iron-containing redox enzyme family protein [Myxococcales bacterium]|nr:iron-containing redox enzyme family protein [Myxococcales bacterium]
MDAKHHWAYPALTRPGLERAQLLVHFRHEYLVYVRDFPVLLARALGNVPPIPAVRRALAENLYEEQTGALSATAPHPELFLQMMAGLGFERSLFTEASGDDALQPAARAYRDFLRERAAAQPWIAAVALLTIFVEGSVNERAELSGSYVRRRGEDAVREHPLVKYYGCPPGAMTLSRAHAEVEGDHRADAWRMVLDHTEEGSADARAALGTCERALGLWLAYRDAVARQMGLPADELDRPARDALCDTR